MALRSKSHSMPHVGIRGKSERPGFTLVTFHVRAELGFGEHVCVIGNVASLGSNNLSRAVELTTTPSTYPVFSSLRDVPIRVGAKVQYSLAIICGGEFQRWITQTDVPSTIASIKEGETIANKSNIAAVALEKQQKKVFSFTVPAQRELDEHVTVNLADRKTNAEAPPINHIGFGSDSDDDVSRQVKILKTSSKTGLNQMPLQHSKQNQQPLSRAKSIVIVVHRLPVQIRKVRVVPSNISSEGALKELIKHDNYSSSEISSSCGSSSSTEANGGSMYRWDIKWSDDAILSKEIAKYAAVRKMRIQWLGQLPVPMPSVETSAERASLAKALRPFHCRAVYLDPEVAIYHDVFVKDTLYPLFHNVVQAFRDVPTRWWAPRRHQLSWRSYSAGCKAYSARVMELYSEGDLIWIQSLYFLLLPPYIARKTLSRASVGLFLHLPFPSSEIFRTLSMRTELLQAMLNADQIGFHNYEYARHFSACCRRILGQCTLNDFSYHPGHIQLENQGHTVNIVVTHAGIEHSAIVNAAKDANVLNGVERIYRKCAGRRLLLGIDFVKPFSGVDLKILAFEKMLLHNPRFLPRVTFVQVLVLPASNDGAAREEINRVRCGLLDLAATLNGRFSFGPGTPRVLEIIEYEQHNFDLPTRLKWLIAADALVHVPLREGFNRIPLEFVAAQHNKPGGSADQSKQLSGSISQSTDCSDQDLEDDEDTNIDTDTIAESNDQEVDGDMTETNERRKSNALEDRPWVGFRGNGRSQLKYSRTGILVLSEVCSCSRVLAGSLTINPASQVELIEALCRVLEMSREEQRDRNDVDAAWVRTRTTSYWASHVLTNLSSVRKKSRYQALGLGFSYRYMSESSRVQRLSVKTVGQHWKTAKKKLLLLDLRGTLVSGQPVLSPKLRPMNNKLLGSHRIDKRMQIALDEAAVARLRPSQKMMTRLKILANDPRAIVAIISGLEKEVMESIFQEIPNLLLLAEHGFHHRLPARMIVQHKGTNSVSDTFGSITESVGREASHGHWKTIRLTLDKSWRSVACQIMNAYVLRTSGSYIKEKASTIIWQYDETDIDFGSEQAKDLQANLVATLRNFNVDVLNGKGYVEIRPRGLTKGAAAVRLIQEYQLRGHGDLELVVCIGDDTSDESMFAALEDNDSPIQKGCKLFTCTVGRKVSAASYFVHDISEVEELVESLSILTMRHKKWNSEVDLVSLEGKFRFRRGHRKYESQKSLHLRSGSSDLHSEQRYATLSARPLHGASTKQMQQNLLPTALEVIKANNKNGVKANVAPGIRHLFNKPTCKLGPSSMRLPPSASADGLDFCNSSPSTTSRPTTMINPKQVQERLIYGLTTGIGDVAPSTSLSSGEQAACSSSSDQVNSTTVHRSRNNGASGSGTDDATSDNKASLLWQVQVEDDSLDGSSISFDSGRVEDDEEFGEGGAVWA